LLKKAGRQSGIDAETERLHEIFQLPHMRQLPLVEEAMGRQTITLVTAGRRPPPQYTLILSATRLRRQRGRNQDSWISLFF
ncbi:hypothetical protein AB0N17_45380, partial [Streptomyces sp. NPDC051133]